MATMLLPGHISNMCRQGKRPVISTLTIAILNYFIDKRFRLPNKKKAIAEKIIALFDLATPHPGDIPSILKHHDWEDAFQYFSAK